MLCKVEKTEDGDFTYKGVEFTRLDRLKGYADYYRTIGKVKGRYLSAPTQKEIVSKINELLGE